MIDSFEYNIRAAFSRFFIETLSERKNEFSLLSKEDATVFSLIKLGVTSGIAIHLKNTQISGLTLVGEEYSPDPIFFPKGFEEIFTPLLNERKEIHPVRLISLLNKQEGIKIISLLLDVPVSKIFLAFRTTKASKESTGGNSNTEGPK